MTRAVVIGATGHVGTYLVPRLVEAGYDVVAISRGQAKPYSPNRAWDDVEMLTMDRSARPPRTQERSLEPRAAHSPARP